MKKTSFSLMFALLWGASAWAAENNLPDGNAAAGKEIFNSVCKYCHGVDYKGKFGPGLRGITDRVDVSWLDRFLKDPAEMVRTDEYARNLRENNDYGLLMPKIPQMQNDAARADVIEFLKTLK